LLSYLRSLLISCSFSYQSDAPHRDLHSFPTRRSSDLVAGGMGARPSLDGMSATHTHMTNSLNTPAEALEYAYPLRVRRYRINKGDRKSTRLNSSHQIISYAVFCLKKKK